MQGESKSILDLTVCNIKAEPNIKSIFIDEEMRYQLESKQARSDHRLTIIEYKMEYHPAPQIKRTITLVHDEFWDHYIEEISKKPNINTQMTTKEKYNLLERHIKRSGKKVIEHKGIKLG